MGRVTLYLKESDSHLTARAFIKATNELLNLLQEVETTMYSKDKAALSWVIAKLGSGSATIELAALGEPALPYSPEEVTSATLSGLRILDTQPVRPPFFSDRAIQHAKALAAMVGKEAGMIAISANGHEVILSPRMTLHVEVLMEPLVEELGTIEGQLKMVTLAGTPYFGVYDDITGKRVSCEFELELLEKIKSALGRRVSVSGLVSYGADGLPKRIREISDLTVFPPDEELPTAEEVLRADLDLTGGLSLEDFMQRIRLEFNGNE